jgi:periplasmic protein TonB
VTQVTPIDAAAKSSSTSGHGREDTGASAGVGAAGGIGVGPGSGSGVFGAAQVAHPPVLISRVMPLYPAKARAHGLDGEVVLRAIIARDGRVEKDIVVAQSSAMFDQPAIDALRQWRFEPGRDHGGNPVRVMLEVPIRFQLR